ncbi:MAG: hypothetical protein UX68_C0040G0001, partial [Parcubacteria group bacterium GW2011_GWA2_46_9]
RAEWRASSRPKPGVPKCQSDLKVIDIASRLPVASVEMSISLWFLVVYYLILGGWLVWYNYNVRFLFPRVAIGNSQSNKSR